MIHIEGSKRLAIVLGLVIVWLLVTMSVGTAQSATVHYTLDDVFLVDGTQMTGSFDWTYAIGDFEGGSGVFTSLEIPWRPNGTAPPLEQEGMVLTIENNQIEISLDGNFHDYGLDISLKFVQPLSPTQVSLVDLNTSFFECCGNGFKDQPFISGSISPIAALPGDCNGDDKVDAGDLSALVLEIFDGDGNLPGNAPGGGFAGTIGCDANEDNNVDAGDLSCTVLTIFNGLGACGAAP